MADPLLVEIIAFAPTAFYHCTHCEVAWHEAGITDRIHREQVAASLPVDLAQEYQVISDWVHDLLQRYGDRVAVKVVDAASLEGVVKSLRYGLHRYPAVVVGGASRFTGPVRQTLGAADGEIAQRFSPANAPVETRT